MSKESPGKFTASQPLGGKEADEKIEYDENLQPNRPAFKDEKEAYKACQNYFDQNKDRNDRDAYLIELFFYRPPFNIKKLADSGYSWVANFSSGFLAAAVASVTPAFKRAVNGTKHLTNARIEGDKKKTEICREKVTKTIREWSGWQNLMDCVIQERTLLGRATVRCVDAYDWRPKFYSTQNSLFPEQCSQCIDEIPVNVFRDEWLPHDFVSNIKKTKVAKANGWNIENCVTVLNKATTKDSNSYDQRTLANWMADGAYAHSYTSTGPVYVETYTLLVVEPDEDGKVSEWVLGKENGELLYFKKNKYESMRDAVAVFSFQQGTNTLHSSRGFGRLLANLHQTYDRNLCKLHDDSYLAGMRIIHPTERRKMDWSITIKSPFIIAPAGTKSEPMNTNISVDVFYAITRQLVGQARQIAGAYSPSTILPDEKIEKTATQATIDAAKEGELREGVLARFSAEMSDLVWMMTKRLLNPKTYDSVAKKLQKELKDEGITAEEIAEFAACPSTDHISSYSTAIRNDKIQKFAVAVKGNPAYDQRRLAYVLAETAVDPEFAKEFVVVNADPELDGQAIHDQQVEANLILRLGAMITPAPLDSDLAHLQVCMQEAGAFIKSVQMPTREQLRGLQNMAKHMEAHIEQAKEKGAKPKETKEFERFVKELVKQVELYATNLVKTGAGGAGVVPAQ